MTTLSRHRRTARHLGLIVGALLALGRPGHAQQTIGTEAPEALPVAVAPNSPLIRYEGRFDTTDAAGPRCSWSASTVSVRFRADALDVTVGESGGSDEYEVVVDGQPAAVLVPLAGSHRYQVFQAHSVGTHTLSLVKRTEAFCGVGQFQGFQLSRGATLLPLPHSRRRVEVIGDSISCGYGNEGKDQNEHFSPATENAYLSYGAVAARAVGAEYVCAAWSGRLMWPTNTMDEVYGRTLPTDPASRWDFTRWVPQAVVIALGTNDFNASALPDAAAWTAGYEAFLKRVRANYPRALLYVASSPMLWGDKDTAERADLLQIVRDENAAGDRNVRFLDFPTQDAARDGLGADWHPSVKTDARMAQVMDAALEHDLGWRATTAPSEASR